MRKASLGIWALVAVGVIVVGVALSAAFGEAGDGNDPFLAEVGNIGQLVAAAALLVIGVVALTRATRRGQRAS